MVERLTGSEGLLLIAVLIGFCVPMFNVGPFGPWHDMANLAWCVN
jgi:hypothetical protein